MQATPDFYMSDADGGEGTVTGLTRCWKLATIRSANQREIVVVRVDPPVSFDGELSSRIVGIASRSVNHRAGEFGGGNYSGGVLWKIRELPNEDYEAVESVGLVMLWKRPPAT